MMESNEAKLDQILSRLDKIEKTVNPPFSKKALKWFIQHFFTIALLVILIYLTWEIWGIVTDILDFTVTFKERMVEILNNSIEKLKFWD